MTCVKASKPIKLFVGMCISLTDIHIIVIKSERTFTPILKMA